MDRDNADVTHQVSSETAFEAAVVFDDHAQTVMTTVNHGMGRDDPTTMFVTVIADTSHQNATQHLIQQDPAVCHQ